MPKGQVPKTGMDFRGLAPVVQKLDSAIHQINYYWISIRETNYPIHWIVFYPLDNAIQLLNNWGLV